MTIPDYSDETLRLEVLKLVLDTLGVDHPVEHPLSEGAVPIAEKYFRFVKYGHHLPEATTQPTPRQPPILHRHPSPILPLGLPTPTSVFVNEEGRPPDPPRHES
jgi:hypothetical protein